jgi:two-component system chemotaxis response regulator CheB
VSRVRVLVVDDSALLRRALRATFESSADFVVIGEAASGQEAHEKVVALAPDLVTMDLDMPGMDGLAAIEAIMADRPTPVLVVTGDPRFRGLDAHFEALTRGAIELLPKPSAFPGTPREVEHLLTTARIAARVPVVPHVRGSAARRRQQRSSSLDLEAVQRVPPGGSNLVVVGASTGGPGALRDLLVDLGPAPACPVIVAQHMTEAFAEGFVHWLGTVCPAPVREARAGMRLHPGIVYCVLRGPHLGVGPAAVLEPVRGGGVHCPSVDALFHSAARHHGGRALGVLLTGMGDDGAAGLAAIAAAGGVTVAQDETTSTVFGMPKAAIDRGAARFVLPLRHIGALVRAATTAPESPHLEAKR